MRVLAYELRRLSGLRSTWLIIGVVLLCDAGVAALLAHQTPAGSLSTTAAVRALTAAVPLLPLPIAAFGAGALGALSYSHEVRYPGLPAARVALSRRIGLMAGKLAVLGPLSLLLALGTMVLNGLVLRFALPSAADSRPVLGLAALGSELVDSGAPGPLGRSLAAFALLVVVGGWAGLLTTSLVRSAAAGLLVLCALPPLVEPAVGLVLRSNGQDWPGWVRELMPFQYGLDWVRGDFGAAGSALEPALLTALLAPAALLLTAAVLVQLRRRAL